MLAPTYEAFSPRIYKSGVNYDQNGHMGATYQSLGNLDPYDYLKSFAGAVHQIANSVDVGSDGFSIENRPEFNQAIYGILENQLSPFFGTSMVTDGLLKAIQQGHGAGEMISSSDTVGARVLEDWGVPDSIAKTMGYAGDPFMPGFTNFIKRKDAFNKSGTHSRSGSTILPSDASITRGLLGFGNKRFDFTAGLNYQLSPHERSISDAKSTFTREVKNRNASQEDILKAFAGAQKASHGAQLEMKNVLDAYRVLGADDDDIFNAMSHLKHPKEQRARFKRMLQTEENGFVPMKPSDGDMVVSDEQITNRNPIDWDTMFDYYDKYYGFPLKQRKVR